MTVIFDLNPMCPPMTLQPLARHRGVHFMPLVAETMGTREPDTNKILPTMPRIIASREDRDPAALYGELLQELNVTVRSFCARAVLRRRVELVEASESGTARLAAANLPAT